MKAITRVHVAAAALGALFAIGLALSGMAAPGKVLGFLDVAGGAWDPQLLAVMGGAVGTAALVRRFARPAPILCERFDLPTRTRVDAPLVAGAAVFGVGWGLSGYCPGPALVSLASPAALVLVAGMIAGIALARLSRGR